MNYTIEEMKHYREVFRKRRSIRISIAITAVTVLIAVTLLAFPSWELFGMPKMTWAPFFYLLMFGLLILIAVVWRCPACNGLLGEVFNTKYCPKCGMKFQD